MIKIIPGIIAALVFSGCASTQTFKAPTQNYRLKGEEKAVQINGALFNYKDPIKPNTLAVGVYLDDALTIQVPLDKGGNGEANGSNFNGKSTSSICHGKPIPGGLNIDCMVFIDNEKTVTLTF